MKYIERLFDFTSNMHFCMIDRFKFDFNDGFFWSILSDNNALVKSVN